MYLLIPLILLICGGDSGWWQAWLYSLLILAAGIGGRMWAEQRHPGITAERQNKESFHNAKAWDKVLAPLMGDCSEFCVGVLEILCQFFNVQHNAVRRIDNDRQIRF